MSEYGSTYKPETGSSRRGLFSRQSDDIAAQMPAATMQDRLADNLQRAVDERLEDGLRTIEEQASDLMREIASEVWRTSGADVRPEQDRIVSLLSRDQAIKGLIATSDERFQALSLRTASLEATLTDLAETGRATREAMTASAEAIRQIADSPTLHGVDTVRSQLEQVEMHIAATFQHLEEREQRLTENVLAQVHEHSDLIARETTRIVEAMQGYVQGGAEAMGQLAQRVEAHAQTFAMRDEHIAERVGEAVGEAVRPVEHLVEARMRGMAGLIRSDSEALRRLIEERTSAQETAALAAIDDRMEAFTTVVEAQLGMLSSSTGEQVLLLSSALAGAIDRSFSRLGDQVDGKLDRVTETVALRAAEATDMAIASSIGTTLEKMTSAARALEGVDTMLVESQTAAEERMLEHIDQRVMAVAKLIRSDNQALAEKVALIARAPAAGGPDPELLRQTLRAVKELQAGLAGDVAIDVAGSMDARFQSVNDQLHKEGQSTAEAMIKVAEVLGEKMDRLSIRVDEGYGNDVQIVIDRMTDAITALSGRARQE